VASSWALEHHYWKDPISGEWIRTFAIIKTDVNEMLAEIHNRMPLILAPDDGRPAYVRGKNGQAPPAVVSRKSRDAATKPPYSAFSPKTTSACGFSEVEPPGAIQRRFLEDGLQKSPI
jgi:hypothetical protein